MGKESRKLKDRNTIPIAKRCWTKRTTMAPNTRHRKNIE